MHEREKERREITGLDSQCVSHSSTCVSHSHWGDLQSGITNGNESGVNLVWWG